MDVFARAGQTMLHRAYDGRKWHPAEDLGPAILGGPAAVARGPDRIDIFVRGADNQLWQKKSNGGWMGYFPLGGLLTAGPAVPVVGTESAGSAASCCTSTSAQ